MRYSHTLSAMALVFSASMGCNHSAAIVDSESSTQTTESNDQQPGLSKAIALVRISSTPGWSDNNRNYEVYRTTQEELITSPFVINSAIRSLEGANLQTFLGREDPVAWLRQQIQVQSLDNSEITQVSLATSNEFEIAQILQAVVEAYLDEATGTLREERFQVLNSAREQRLKRMNELEEKLEELSKSGSTPYALPLANHRITQLTTRLDELRILEDITGDSGQESARIKAEIKATNKRLAEVKAEAASKGVELEVLSFEIQQLKSILADTMQEIASLERHLPDPPRVTLVQPAIIERDSPDDDATAL